MIILFLLPSKHCIVYSSVNLLTEVQDYFNYLFTVISPKTYNWIYWMAADSGIMYPFVILNTAQFNLFRFEYFETHDTCLLWCVQYWTLANHENVQCQFLSMINPKNGDEQSMEVREKCLISLAHSHSKLLTASSFLLFMRTTKNFGNYNDPSTTTVHIRKILVKFEYILQCFYDQSTIIIDWTNSLMLLWLELPRYSESLHSCFISFGC